MTYGDIISVSPYGNYIVTKQVTGKQLREILETAVDIQVQCIAADESGDYDTWSQSSGSYLQTGGLGGICRCGSYGGNGNRQEGAQEVKISHESRSPFRPLASPMISSACLWECFRNGNRCSQRPEIPRIRRLIDKRTV